MIGDIFDLTDRIVILTGGLGLIGFNYILALIQRGAKVVVIDIISREAGEKLLNAKIKDKRRQQVFYFQGDIASRYSLLAIKKKVIARFRHIDVLINNAVLNPKVEGSFKAKSTRVGFEKLGLEDWEKEIKVNLTGTMLCCQVFGAVLPAGSSIINIASIYGLIGPDQSIYSNGFVKPATYGVSKGAIISLTKYLATYWGKKSIRVNCVVLGGVYNGQNAAFVKKYSTRTPLGRMARPDEFNGLVVYLASNASSYATGALFVVDGGWTAW